MKVIMRGMLLLKGGKKMSIKRLFILSVLIFMSSTAAIDARSLNEVFDKVNPTVVVIFTKERGYSKEKPGETQTSGNLGSGFVISKDGLIMTAAHVVQVADMVTVQFLNGAQADAKVMGADKTADVALLKLTDPPSKLFVAKLGNSDKVKIGEQVFVVGAPHGLFHTLTVGYISGRRRPGSLSNKLLPLEFLQTDAAINTGNSGGPMFNSKGEVIGIVSSILSKSRGFEGVGFATSINVAKELMINQKPVWIGIDPLFVTGVLAQVLNVPQEAGILIQRVAQNSPGHRLGFKPSTISAKIGEQELFIGGDIVLAVQGIPISLDLDELDKIREALTAHPDLKNIEFKVLREGKIVKLRRSK
jgi:S1-C subfamily serine protease